MLPEEHGGGTCIGAADGKHHNQYHQQVYTCRAPPSPDQDTSAYGG